MTRPQSGIAYYFHNAKLFIGTKKIAGQEKRRKVLRETYEEVCRFIWYYHKLEKRTKRA